MKKKLFSILCITFLMMFGLAIKANASIESPDDIKYRVEQLREFSQFDLLSLINKGELIGWRLDSYKMTTQFYINSVVVATDNLDNILNQIDLVINSTEYSDTEKSMQIRKLYADAQKTLYELDTRTISYMMELKNSVPTITYERYAQKFQEIYNNLQLTGNNLYLE